MRADAVRRSLRDGRAALALGLRADPRRLAGQVVLLLLGAALPVLAAWLTKLLFDELIDGEVDRARAGWLAAGAAAAGAATAIALHVAGYLAERRRHEIELLVQDRLYARVNRYVGLRPFEDPEHLGRLRLAEEAAAGAPQAIVTFALELAQAVVVAAGFVAALLAIWPPMVPLLALAVVPAVGMQLAIARRHAAAVEGSTEPLRRRVFYQSLLTEVRAAQEVRLYGLAGLFAARMARSAREANRRLLGAERRAAAVQSLISLLAAVVGGVGSVVVVLAVGAGRASVGDLVLFVAAVAGVQAAVAGVATQLGQVAEALRLFVHYTAVVETPDDPAPPGRAGRPAPPLRRGIELRDVWFRYRPDGPWVLCGINLTIPYGTAVGLVGLNGAGKTSLVKLLCRFYDPDRGAILWDGTDLRDFDVSSLRYRLGATFQDFMTYDLSAAENVGVGDVRYLDDRPAIHRAADRAGVHDVLSALPAGYDTLLSRIFFDEDEATRGVVLSGGQWQRVAVARAFVRADSDLLIMDEPSSGLDAEAEHRIHRALRAYRAGRTSLLISHRLSAIRDADVIAVLAGGVVAELGDHDSLMVAGGEYARLFALQAGGYQDRRLAAAGDTW